MTDYPEYPTEDDLKFIREFKAFNRPIMELIEHIEGIWHYGEWGFKLQKNKRNILGKPTWILELHTGGWSGNEDIMGAIIETDWWMFCWMEQKRGGHYLIEIPKWIRERHEEKEPAPPGKGE